MSESTKHWSKTINKLENVINVNNNTVVNITSGITEVPRAESAENAAKATADSNNNNIINTYATKKEVVNISSSQEIAGVKTFTSNPVISTTDNAHLTLQTTDITLGTIHNTTESCGTMIVDSKNNEIGSFLVNMIGTGSGISDNLKNSTISEMSANNGTVSGSVSVVVENNGARYATAPSTPATASSNEIVTVDYLKTNFSVNGATASNAGVMKLYSSTGDSEDGTMTRKSITEALNSKSPLASPAFTGTPTAPTATAGTSTTQIATTEFVTTAVSEKANDSSVVKLSGNQTISGTKTFSSTISGSIDGNAATATTASSCSGNAATATKLAASKNIALTGDVTGSAGFDGSVAASIATTLANSGVTAGSYGPSANATPAFGGTFSVPYITVDAKGRTTASSTKTITIPALDMSNATAGTLAVARGGTGLTASPSMLINLASTTAANVLAASPRPGVTGVLPVANGGTGSSTKNFVDLSSNQTVAGNKTFSGRVFVSNSTDIEGATANSGSLIVGSETGQHLGIDSNEIISKKDGTTPGTLSLQADGGYMNCGVNTALTTFTVNATTSTFSGTLTAANVYNAVWNDYAEFFPRGEETEAGDFVALSLDSDNEVYVKASKETSKSVGIHSDSFGHLIGGEQVPEGQDFVKYNLPKYIPVGLVGRVRANIVGEVKKGDFIVISDIPGVGRAFNKETDSYVDIIGMACESSSEKDIKRIKVKLGN